MANPEDRSYEVVCPHCSKTFEAEPMGVRSPRHTGFKCPHCRLFVAFERAEDQEQVEPVDGS